MSLQEAGQSIPLCTNAEAVRVNALSFRYAIDAPDVLRNVAFELPRGARCLCVGRNGAGKTTLLGLLGGKRMSPNQNVRVQGKDPFQERGLSSLVEGAAETDPSVGTVSSYLEAAEVYGEVDPARRAHLLASLGVRTAWDLSKRSAGERRRARLVLTLMHRRPLEVLDEATAGLDPLIRRRLLDLLREDSEKGSTIILCTHILDGLHGWATHMLHMENGMSAMLAPSPTENLVEMIREQLLASAPPGTVVPSSGPLPQFSHIKDLPGPVIELSDVSWPPAFQNISMQLPRGCRCLVFGLGGSGKSAVLSVAAGRRMAQGGSVKTLGLRAFTDFKHLDPQVGFIGDDWKRQISEMGVGKDLPFEEVAAGACKSLVLEGYVPALVEARLAHLAKYLGVNPKWRASETSEGQRRRIQLVLALLKPRRLLVLDEATADLDLLGRDALLGLLRAESEAGVSVLIAASSFSDFDNWASHLLQIMRHGQIGFCGPVSDAPPGPLEEVIHTFLDEEDSRSGPELEEKPRQPLAHKTPFQAEPAMPSGWRYRINQMPGAQGTHSWGDAEGECPFAEASASMAREQSMVQNNQLPAHQQKKDNVEEQAKQGSIAPARPAMLSVQNNHPSSQDILPPGWGDRHAPVEDLVKHGEIASPNKPVVKDSCVSSVQGQVTINELIALGVVPPAKVECLPEAVREQRMPKDQLVAMGIVTSEMLETAGRSGQTPAPIEKDLHSTPFGWGNRHLSENELMARGIILPDKPLSTDDVDMVSATQGAQNSLESQASQAEKLKEGVTVAEKVPARRDGLSSAHVSINELVAQGVVPAAIVECLPEAVREQRMPKDQLVSMGIVTSEMIETAGRREQRSAPVEKNLYALPAGWGDRHLSENELMARGVILPDKPLSTDDVDMVSATQGAQNSLESHVSKSEKLKEEVAVAEKVPARHDGLSLAHVSINELVAQGVVPAATVECLPEAVREQRMPKDQLVSMGIVTSEMIETAGRREQRPAPVEKNLYALPAGWGDRHLSENELMARGVILPDKPLSTDDVDMVSATQGAQNTSGYLRIPANAGVPIPLDSLAKPIEKQGNAIAPNIATKDDVSNQLSINHLLSWEPGIRDDKPLLDHQEGAGRNGQGQQSGEKDPYAIPSGWVSRHLSEDELVTRGIIVAEKPPEDDGGVPRS